MRKLIFTQFVSLDGVVDNPMWSFPYWNDQISDFKRWETENSDALLLGRITYEGFAAAWPNSKDEGAEYFNGVRKYVVSTTLQSADWNNSAIIRDNVLEEVARLKATEGQNITIHGSGALADTLLNAGLIDSVRMLVYPVVVGAGNRLFKDGTKAKLKLVESQTFDGGVLGLVYEPANS
jgi:dihydrofolate reductase